MSEHMNNILEYQHKLSSTLSCIGDGVVTTDLDGNVDFMNEQAQFLTGWNVAEAIGEPLEKVFTIVCPDSMHLVNQRLKEVIETGEVRGLTKDAKLQNKNGFSYYVSASFSVVKDINKEPIGTVIVFRDITRIKTMEETINNEKNNLMMMFEVMPLGMIVIDHDRVVKQVNSTLLEMFTIKKELIIEQLIGDGLNCEGSIPNGCGQGAKCSHCDLRREVIKVIQTDQYSKDRIIELSTISEGTLRNMWCKMSFAPMWYLEEQRVMIIIEDITEQIRYEERLILAQQSSLQMLDGLPVMVLKSNIDMYCDYVNQTFLDFIGTTKQDAMSNIKSYIHPEDLPLFSNVYLKSFLAKKSFEIELRMRRKDGDYRYVLAIGRPYFDVADYFSGFIGAIFDMTEAKQVEMELKSARDQAEAANKAKSQFLANMSHEIRTPLNGMVGMIDLTLLTPLKQEQKENLEVAKSCANSLLNIINDILDISKLEAGKMKLKNNYFSVRTLVDEVEKTNKAHAQDKNLKLITRIDQNTSPYYQGDVDRIKQILNNLITNAIKFTQIGEVIIEVKRSLISQNMEELMFSVKDTGIGISPEDTKRLFKSFTQIDASYTRQYGGSGLGLVISKQLVEMMNGKIWLESTKGKGSTFFFTITLRVAQQTQNLNHCLKVPEKSKTKGHILVVEDDKINQIVITRRLKEQGYTYDVANNGVEALSFHESKCYDVILMDIQMPVMDGIEATKRIRLREGQNRHTSIIAVTAFALMGDRERFLSFGMDEYISKPIKFDSLFSLMDQMISKPIKIFEIPEHTKGLTKISTNILDDNQLLMIRKQLTQIKALFQQRDYVLIERYVHVLKELFEMLNLEVLKSTAFKMELAMRRSNIQQAEQHMFQLEEEFRKIE